MRIVEARLHPYALPLVRPWQGASAIMPRRQGALVCVVTDDGVTGWGDCAPLPSRGEQGLRAAMAALAEAAARLPGATGEAAHSVLDSVTFPEARWALETALLDAEARAGGLTLARHLSVAPHASVAVNAALGALDEGCIARAQSALAARFAIAKIKVGLHPIEDEIAVVRDVAAATGGRLLLRLDANRAWGSEDARRMLAAACDLPIESVEEPLADPAPAVLAALQAMVPFAIAVDESLPALGLRPLLDQRSMRRLVMKPARLGGLRSVLRMADTCASAGVDVVLTSVVDTAIGVTAAAQLAAALPRPAVHGLATSVWLAEDVAPAPVITEGALQLSAFPGLGVEPFGELAQR